MGEHKGGYDRFSFDITSVAEDCTSGKLNEIIIQVCAVAFPFSPRILMIRCLMACCWHIPVSTQHWARN